MGIRISKTIGYGLTDVKHDGGTIIDERFNKNSIVLDVEKEDDFSAEKYLSWLRKKHEKMVKDKKEEDMWMMNFDLVWEIEFLEKNPKWDTYRGFIYDNEFGLSNVFCVVPAWHTKQWHRRDDTIDYMEETLKAHENPKFDVNYVKLFDWPIYPYISWMDRRTGKVFTGINDRLAADFMRRTNATRRDPTQQFDSTHLAEKLGFSSVQECEDNVRIAVPGAVRLLCEFCEIFVDLQTINDLVPMLYVHWS